MYWLLLLISTQALAKTPAVTVDTAATLQKYQRRLESLAEDAKKQIGDKSSSLETLMSGLKDQVAGVSKDLEQSMDFESGGGPAASPAVGAKTQKVVENLKKWMESLGVKVGQEAEKSVEELRKIADEIP